MCWNVQPTYIVLAVLCTGQKAYNILILPAFGCWNDNRVILLYDLYSPSYHLNLKYIIFL